MKAAMLHKIGERLTIEEISRPQPGVGEVLVKVRACGIDGTDLKLLDGFGYVPELPFIMGARDLPRGRGSERRCMRLCAW